MYLLDTRSVFRQEEGSEDAELAEVETEEGIDLNIPLVGYAIGFPPIDPDPGGTYLKGDYNLSDDEDEEVDEEDTSLPDDIYN